MVISALTKKAVNDVIAMRGQVIAIVLLIAAGSATFIMMRSMHASLVASLQDYYTRYRYPSLFVDVRQAPNSIVDLVRDQPGVADIELRIRKRVSIDVPGLQEVASAEVLSLPTGDQPLAALYVVTGSLPNAEQTDRVVVYAPFAEANQLNIGDTITATINGKRTQLSIAATAISPEFLIIVSPGTLMLDSRRNAVLWMPYDAIASRYNMVGAWNAAVISMDSTAPQSIVVQHVDELIKQYGAFGVTTRDDQLSHRFITDEIRQNEVSAIIIPSIIYGVAIFLLNISINRLVLTQRTIIAILRSFGYQSLRIVIHYVAIAMLIVALGTALGIMIGYVGGVYLAGWYMEFYRFPTLLFSVPHRVVLLSLILAILSAIIGAATAIRSVTRMQPAEAMRPPMPKHFRPGLITRITRNMSLNATSRLMLQNIDRRMMQSAVVVLMVGLATSIIMIARYTNDAMDHMMMVEYDRAKLADATVTFSSAVPLSSARELESIKGIGRIEPFRLIGIDLVGKNRTYRTTLAGRNPQSKLMRLADQYGVLMAIPTSGIVISRYLAKLMGLNVGDTLRVVSLETTRDTLRTILTGTVNEALGAQCYAAHEVLSRLRNEEPLANGAFVSVEPGMDADVQEALKDRSAVLGVLFRSVMIKSFRDVYGTNVLVVASYLLVLACLVAVGVLYNNARIVISERSAELSSLRIQGCTVAEVTTMVLGEQGILTLAGMPLGLILGAYMCYQVAGSIEADFLRLPFVISRYTVFVAVFVVVAVSIGVAWRIYFMIRKLELVAVLKERV